MFGCRRLQDGRRLVAAALRVPNVMPATVVLRPDGSVAQTLPRDFATADEIAAAVGNDADESASERLGMHRRRRR